MTDVLFTNTLLFSINSLLGISVCPFFICLTLAMVSRIGPALYDDLEHLPSTCLREIAWQSQEFNKFDG